MRPRGGATHTVVNMAVAKETFDEIERKMRAAGYEHTFDEEKHPTVEGLKTVVAIDMTHIAVVVEKDETDLALQRKRVARLLERMNPGNTLTEEQLLEQAEILIGCWDLMRLPKNGTHKICHMVNDCCVICGSTE